MRYLALDGPSDCNGQYLTAAQGHARGYYLSEWPNGEKVLVQSGYMAAAVESALDGIEGLPDETIPGTIQS